MLTHEPERQVKTNPPEDTTKNQSTPSRSLRLKERLVTKLVGLVPTMSLGVALRRLLYPMTFARMGKSAYIENGAEISGTYNIELGDSVRISRNARIEVQGPNNRLILGSKVFLDRNVSILGFENSRFEIGDRTFMNSDVLINGPGNIKIGQDCLIGPRTVIMAVNHCFNDLTRPINIQGYTAKGIVIEDDCWLACGVIVLDGVTIGRGSIIGAGAVVTKDIPPYSIAVGVPARVISQRKG
jgi:galactoside O-acetyltransferase